MLKKWYKSCVQIVKKWSRGDLGPFKHNFYITFLVYHLRTPETTFIPYPPSSSKLERVRSPTHHHQHHHPHHHPASMIESSGHRDLEAPSLEAPRKIEQFFNRGTDSRAAGVDWAPQDATGCHRLLNTLVQNTSNYHELPIYENIRTLCQTKCS